jgi:NAD(P)-dependent dehydrogenase (short-subunit alcohol dehydrogenase family)
MATAFARAGADLVLVARSTRERPNRSLPGTLDEAQEAASSASARVLAIAEDLARDGAVERIVQQTLGQFGRCDILVHNAAVTFIGPFDQVPPSRWRAALSVNLLAPVALSHALLPDMLERGSGCVIHLSSGAALADRGPLQLPYAASKAALERVALGLHHQFGGRGVAFHCVRIDELIPTEGAAFGAPETLGQARSSPEDFADAMVWLTAHGQAHSGRVLTLDPMRQLGALRSSLASPST